MSKILAKATIIAALIGGTLTGAPAAVIAWTQVKMSGKEVSDLKEKIAAQETGSAAQMAKIAALLAENEKLKAQLENQIAFVPDPNVLHRSSRSAADDRVRILSTQRLSVAMTLAHGGYVVTERGGVSIAYIEREGPVFTLTIGNDVVPMVMNQPKPYLTADNRHCELTITGLSPKKELTIFEACVPYLR
jgi:hypothetical protein